MIATYRRLEYARGYLALGLARQARDELAAIAEEEQKNVDVQEVWVDVWMELKSWKRVVRAARGVCEKRPAGERAWIAWAYALRELQRVEEAQDVLWRAEKRYGQNSGLLHYNLACYACLLGNQDEAERRLKRAVSMDTSWRDAALEDPDLKDLRPRLDASN
ncbi:MAG TPA: hypothetical protein VFT72_18745 [Opitutaceae bacterium]|nr:hypothetical protein [Opitutaceae bacterium]